MTRSHAPISLFRLKMQGQVPLQQQEVFALTALLAVFLLYPPKVLARLLAYSRTSPASCSPMQAACPQPMLRWPIRQPVLATEPWFSWEATCLWSVVSGALVAWVLWSSLFRVVCRKGVAAAGTACSWCFPWQIPHLAWREGGVM